ncbi:AmmeMemoRadiSam system protein B [Candidatus Shapirobacteria bacterium]|nr:AmmeMemoRadiSam system protein B [Candidatus Shapirobacteria bacterium]
MKKKVIIGSLILVGLLVVLAVALALKAKEKMEKILIREPAVAGQFYPAEKEALAEQVASFLAKAGPLKEGKKAPNFLIVPHAGYPYSGAVAAQAFARVREGNFKTVILLGPAHQVYFLGAAIDGGDFWQTPLGKVALDREKITRLEDKETGIVVNRLPHQNEHCLEVMLPFLQKVLGENFKIIPILLGQTDENVLASLAQKISNIFNEQTLLVVSSDLSHYPPADLARTVDEQTVAAILSGKEELFLKTLKELGRTYPQVATFACGEEAIRVGLKVGQILGTAKQKLFSLTNSGEITGQTDQAVGYAAIAFWLKMPKLISQSGEDKAQGELSQEGKRMLLSWARQVLESYFEKGKVPDQPPPTPALAQKRGVFVTLKEEGQLRGCIGDFSANEPLWEKVEKMALAAAFDDPRFPPLTPEELDKVKIEISVLSPLQKINSIEEIEMGKHGVYLKYGNRSATFLPQVAKETGWEREEFLDQLCLEKAGLPAGCWRHPQTELFSYTAEVFGEE